MPRLRRSLLTAVTALLVLAPSALADCPSADVRPDGANAAEVRAAVVCLTNVERAAAGLGALTAEGRLEAAGQAYADRMATEDFFAHVSPDGSTMPQRLAAYTEWLTLGENLAWGEEELATPRATVAAWMASPGHRANILNGDFEEVGIGVAAATPTSSSRPGATYAAEYGAREASAAPAPAHTTSPAGTAAPRPASAVAPRPAAATPRPASAAPRPAAVRPPAKASAPRRVTVRRTAAHTGSCRATVRRAALRAAKSRGRRLVRIVRCGRAARHA